VELFLGSQGLGALPDWLTSQPRRPARAVLVPTAGNRLPAMPWVDVAASTLTANGLVVDRHDLEFASPAETAAALSRADLVFVTGGYLFFLLEHAQRTGFLREVAGRVRAGELAYAGMSAGAMLAARELAIYRDDEDPGRVTDTAGAGLIDFCPLVHADRGREEYHARIIREHGDRYTFVRLRDDEAVLLSGSTWRTVRS
jgi:dipeptidase E